MRSIVNACSLTELDFISTVWEVILIGCSLAVLRLDSREHENPKHYPLVASRGFLLPRSYTVALHPHEDVITPTATFYIWMRLNWYVRRVARLVLLKYPWIIQARGYEGNSLDPARCLNHNSRNVWAWYHSIDEIRTVSLHGNLYKAILLVLINLIETRALPFSSLSPSLDLYPIAWSLLLDIYRKSIGCTDDVGRSYIRSLHRWEAEALLVCKNKTLPLPHHKYDLNVVERIWSVVKERDKRTNKNGGFVQTLCTYEDGSSRAVQLSKPPKGLPSFTINPVEMACIRSSLEALVVSANRSKNSHSRRDRRTTAAFYAIKGLLSLITPQPDNTALARLWAHGLVRDWIITVDDSQQGRASDHWKEAPTWIYVFSTSYEGYCKVGIAHIISHRIRNPDCADLYAKEVFKVQLPTRAWAFAVESVVLQRTSYAADCPEDLLTIAGWSEVRKMDVLEMVRVVREVSDSALCWERPLQSWSRYGEQFL